MKILLWEMGEHFQYVILWDGENTYWTEEMRPSTGYKGLDFKFGRVCKITNSRFTLMGDL